MSVYVIKYIAKLTKIFCFSQVSRLKHHGSQDIGLAK